MITCGELILILRLLGVFMLLIGHCVVGLLGGWCVYSLHEFVYLGVLYGCLRCFLIGVWDCFLVIVFCGF